MRISGKEKIFFQEKGYLVVENILTEEEVSYYDEIYNSFLDNKIDALKFRSDLSGSDDKSSFEVPDAAFMALELTVNGLKSVSGTVIYPKEIEEAV